jgi:hypothetical protein
MGTFPYAFRILSVSVLFALIAPVALAEEGVLNTSRPLDTTSSKPPGTDLMLAPAPKSYRKNGEAPTGPGVVATAPDGSGGQTPVILRPFVASVETFGSPRIDEATLRKFLGKDLDRWLEMGLNGDPKSIEVENQLAERVKKKFGFATAEWSIVQYFEPGKLPIHITLDVVEPADVAKRMPFQAAPTAENADPGNLIKAWMDYENIALDLVEMAQLEPDAEECVAFHCPFGHKHEKLKPFERLFVEGVKTHLPALETILKTDKRPEWRASAAYLLAYSKDGKKVVNLLVDRIKDPDAIVRNNALRVLGDIAEFHSELVIPTGPVLEALHFPRASDRSKALYTLYNMALHSAQVRDQILKGHVPVIVELLSSKQPDHKELAHALLRKISGREFAQNDLKAWKNWSGKLR